MTSGFYRQYQNVFLHPDLGEVRAAVILFIDEGITFYDRSRAKSLIIPPLFAHSLFYLTSLSIPIRRLPTGLYKKNSLTCISWYFLRPTVDEGPGQKSVISF